MPKTSPPWKTHKDMRSFPQRREREGMGSRRVPEGIPNFILASYLLKKKLALQQRKIMYEMNICIVI